MESEERSGQPGSLHDGRIRSPIEIPNIKFTSAILGDHFRIASWCALEPNPRR
jgi:hypothetical protein